MLSAPRADRLREVFADAPAVRAVYLFGSHARGTARPDSDVDLGLVVTEGFEPTDKLDLLTECVRAGEENVDLVVLNDAPPVVRFEAVSPNALLYREADFDHGSFFSRVLRRYWDLKPLLDVQRAAYKRRLLHSDDSDAASHGSS